ncbi:polysaccharide pyruvyl transferase family protein [Methyloligella solikamskensis]|uniref:Polysaccharide pyruvyl transferase family protein n=1 Tax=Methyloligella solikamskensis TaxID=1177756 RepID=A0ABW3JAI5_9HYPH
MTRTLRAVLVNDTAAKGHHGCALVNRQLAELAREAGIGIAHTLPLTASWETIKGEAPDLIVVNGEGTLHHDTKGAHAIAALGAKAQAAGPPAFLINTICQDLPPSLGEGLKGYTCVFARDRYSQQSFAEHGMTAGYAPDLTLTYRAPDRERRGDTLFITDSSMGAETTALFRLSETLPGARFLPLRSRPPEGRGLLDREALRYRVRTTLARIHPDPVYRARYLEIVEDFDDFIGLLQTEAGFLLAGRFHAVCIALDLGLPFFAVPPNSWKVEALLEEVGLSHRLLPGAEAFAEKAAGLPPSQIAPFTKEERAAIARFKQMALSENRAMFQQIADAVRH